jgi:hypothetical protein
LPGPTNAGGDPPELGQLIHLLPSDVPNGAPGVGMVRPRHDAR